MLDELLPKFVEAEVHEDWDMMVELGERILQYDTRQEVIRIKIATAYNHRGRIYVECGNLVNALSDLNRSIELNPTKEAYRNRGKVSSDNHQYDLALSDFNQAVQLDRKDTQSLQIRADTYRALGRCLEAEADELQIQWEVHRSAGR
jgi:tetratricopeptide (TPR) repeat protein